MAAGAHARLLGAVQFVAADGATVDLPSTTQRRLFAVLAVGSGATIRPEYLSDLLELSPGALRTAVSRLRARLGDGAIQTDGAGYRLVCTVDADVFTALLRDHPEAEPDPLPRLETALAMWNGDALDEFRHEPWAQAEAFHLEELRALAIEDRAEILIARARSGEAVAALEAHVAFNPLRDRARGLLIKALAGEGRQADALRAYHDYRAFLAEETGTEPSALVRSIERRVAAGSLDGTEDAEPMMSAPRPSRGDSGELLGRAPLHGVLARELKLIGRVRELRAMEAEVARARTGSFRSVLLSGEAGIGKTTLLGAFARAEQGDTDDVVLYGRCDEGAAVPFEPFRSIVGSIVEHAPVSMLREHIERCGGDLSRIAPNLANRVWMPPPSTSDDATERFQLFEAVADLLRRVCEESPMVLILDDLHWAEPTALRLLRHLTGALVDTAILVVVSFRDTGESESAEFRAVLAALDRLDARRVRLAGFDDIELDHLVASVVASSTGSTPEVIGQLRDETAGNPLYAAQLVRHLAETAQLEIGDDGVRFTGDFAGGALPRNLLDLVWTRVRALGESTSEVLCAAAVLGLEFAEETLIDVVEESDDAVAQSIDAAVAAGLLAETEATARTLRFTHALVARALYAELDGSARRRLHQRAARVLEKRADDLPQAIVVQVARHWALGGDEALAQHWATVAGDYALEHLAPSEAATWFRAALDLAIAAARPDFEQAALMVRLGEALHRVGDPTTQATLRAGAKLAQACGADDVLIRAALATDRGLMRVMEVDEELLAILEAALAVVDEHDTTTYARLLVLYAQELVSTARTELRLEVARRAVDLIEAGDDPMMLPQLVSGLTFALWGPGTLPLRRDLAERAIAAASKIDDPSLQFWAARAGYFVAIESADAAGARRNAASMRSIAQRVGEPRLRWVTAVIDAFDAIMEARFEEGEQYSNLMLEVGTQIGDPDAFTLYVGQIFMNRSFVGRYDELLPLVEAAMKDNPDFLGFRVGYALIGAVAGRRDEARAILRAGVADGFARIPFDNYWMTVVIGYAVLAIELQDAEVAAQLYPILEPFGEEVSFNGATSQGYIGAYLGKLASLLGWHDIADEHLQRSLAVNVAFGWEYHRATTLVAMALSRQRRTGRLDADAHAWLDDAVAIGNARGLRLLLQQVEQLRA